MTELSFIFTWKWKFVILAWNILVRPWILAISFKVLEIMLLE